MLVQCITSVFQKWTIRSAATCMRVSFPDHCLRHIRAWSEFVERRAPCECSILELRLS